MNGQARRALLDELRTRVADERVLGALAEVPRERFVPPDLTERAYENVALAIDCGQTISQPLVVARMTELLELDDDDRVLDVGTGSGYHAAVLARLARHVWSIERHRLLAEQAARALRDTGVANVTVLVGDGARGLPAEEPFDAINVAAAAPRAVLEELAGGLAAGGRLVAPVSGRRQRLVTLRRGEL
ncbi:MAG TPA: protein-L-isoaspartate(D-aspartate) O-methyltransferase, partial [Solirubrobacteraceae bacterium]